MERKRWTSSLIVIIILLLVLPLISAFSTTEHIEFSLGANYSLYNVSHEPIKIGESVTWTALFTNTVKFFPLVYQTAPVNVTENLIEDSLNWEKQVLFKTEYSGEYTDIDYTTDVPSLELSIDPPLDYELNEQKLSFILPKLNKEALVTIKGSNVAGEIYSDGAKLTTNKASITSFNLTDDNSLSFKLNNIQGPGQASLTLPFTVSARTSFFVLTDLGTEIPIPYTLEDETLLIDWGAGYGTLSNLQKSSLTIYGDLIPLSVSTDKETYLLGETVDVRIAPQNLTSFVYVFDPEGNVSVLYHNQFKPSMGGNYTIEASIYDGDKSFTLYTDFVVITNGTYTEINFSTNKEIYVLNETVEFTLEPDKGELIELIDSEGSMYVLDSRKYTPYISGNYSAEVISTESVLSPTLLFFEVVEKINLTNLTSYTLETLVRNKYANEEQFFPVKLEITKDIDMALEIETDEREILSLFEENKAPEQEKLPSISITEQSPIQRLVETSLDLPYSNNISLRDYVIDKREEVNFKKELLLKNQGRINATLTFSNMSVKEIAFNDISMENGSLNLGIKDVKVDNFDKAYAIDPEQLNFTEAEVTVVATGDELYKCKEWDFATETCPDDDWIKFMDITPGEIYKFTLTPDDPGFGEKTKSDSNQFLVQRGTASGSTAQLTDTLGTSVNTSQSFLHFYPVTASATPDDWQFTGTISSSTGLTFDSYNTVAANVYWEVVTSENLFVQRGQETLLINNATATITLSDEINTSRSFVIVHGRCNSSSNTDTRGGFFLGDLTDGTTLELVRGNATLCDSVVDWQVIEWLGATVQSGPATIIDNADAVTVSISSVNLSNSILFFGTAVNGSDQGMDSNNIHGSFNTSTQLVFTQYPGTGYADSRKELYWYVVEAPELTVQSSTYYLGAVSGTTGISSVNMSRAFTSASFWSTGGGQTWGRGQSGVAITAANTLTLYKGQTGQNNNISWFVAEYGIFDKTKPNVTLDKPDPGYTNSTDEYVNLTFNASITDNDNLSNCSLWHNYNGTWLLNQTVPVSGVSDVASFNLTQLTYSSFVWNVECYDTYGNNDWGDANRTVTLDWVIPLDYTSRTCSDAWGGDCTVDACPEGIADDTFNTCESCDNTDEHTKLTRVNATTIGLNESLEVTCIWDAGWSTDYVYMWYYNGTGWKELYSNSGNLGNNFEHSLSFTPDAVEGEHWIRCSVSYNSPVLDFCSDTEDNGYGDNDDVNFNVKKIIYKSPNVTLDAPLDDSGVHTPGLVLFNYTPFSDRDISNCSLIVNDSVVDTDISIVNNVSQQLSYTFSSIGLYTWFVNCTNDVLLENSSEVRSLHIFEADEFFSYGSVTNLTEINMTNINELRIKHNNYGEITYIDSLNLSGGSDLDAAIGFSEEQITVNPEIDSRLNASAKISIYNLSYSEEPIPLKDGVVCLSDCEVVNYNSANGNFTFNVTGFSTYSADANAKLNIYDTSDLLIVLPGEQISFLANYSKTIDGKPLNGSNYYCEFIENSSGSWSSPLNMTFDNQTDLYKTNNSFSTGSYKFNVTCKNIASYENLSLIDSFSVGEIADDLPIVTLVNPPDEAPKAETQINFTCDATDDKGIINLTLYTNTSGDWEFQGSKDFTETIILNATWGEDVLTSGEFPNDGEDALGESLGQDYRVVEKFDLSSLPNTAKIVSVELRAYVDILSSSSNHRTTVYPYYSNVSYNPIPDNAVDTYDRINDGTAFVNDIDICSSSKSTGYSSWMDLGSLAAFYAGSTLSTTDLFSIGLIETGENDGICSLAEYSDSGSEPQLRITYVPGGIDFETNFSVNDTTLGNYSWNCEAVDTGFQSVFSTANRTVERVRSYYPIYVSLVEPANETEFNYSTDVKFNISASDGDGLSNCTLWTDKSGTWNPVTTKTYSGTQDSKVWSLSGFTNGTHKYNAYCCDNYNDCDWNESDSYYTIFLDYENPNVTSVSPSPGSSYNLNDVLNISANVVDDRNVSLVEAYLEYDGGTQTYTMTDDDSDDFYNATFNIQYLGRINITIKAYDAENNLNDSETTWINVTYTTSAAIYCEDSPCIANESLIQYHDGMSATPEPNGPNTIDSCTDGIYGVYQTDESIDHMSLESLNGSDFRIGDTVEFNITTYTWNDASDNLNFIYANDTSAPVNWKVQDYIYPVPLTGFNTYSKTFVLEGDVGVQAIRGSIQYLGNVASTCGTGNWDDNDDIEFLVQKARESNVPEAILLEPNYSTTYYYSDIITINANVTDENDLGRIYVEIEKGIQSWEINLTDLNQDGIYTGSFSDTTSIGNYTIQLFTIDEFGNENNSETDWFIVADTGTLEITALGCVPSTVNVTNITVCRANASDSMVPIGTVVANVTYPNETIESQTVGNVGESYNFSFSSNLAGDYDVLWWVNNSNGVSRTDVDTFRVNELNKPNVTILAPTQDAEYNTSQYVNISANVTDDIMVDFVYAEITLPNTSIETTELTKQANNITYEGNYYLSYQDGNYSIRIVANDSSGNINNSETTWINVSYVSSGAKVCFTSPCIVDSSLIRSKDSLATAEPNSPNTLDACSDGSIGTYGTDESIENITMYNLNGTKFRGGDTVEVNITAYCVGTRTNVNFVYANDSSSLVWKVVDFQDPCSAGLTTVSRQFVLDKTLATHAFRAIAKYQGTGVATCGGASRDDNDDFEFVVYKPREYNPPEVVFILPNESIYQVGTVVPVRINITEETDIDYLYVNLSWDSPIVSEELVMVDMGGGIYEANVTNTSYFGNYTIHVYVNDTQTNLNNSENVTFEVGDAIKPIIHSYNATPNSTVQGNNITIYANVTDDYSLEGVRVDIEGINYTMNPLSGDVFYYEFNTSIYSAGFYNFTIYANDTKNQATPYTSNFTIEKRTSLVQLFLNGSQDNFSLYEDEYSNISSYIVAPTGEDIEMYDNDVLFYNGSAPYENISINSVLNYHNITVYYPGNENYTATSETFYLIVNERIPPNVTLLSPNIDTGDNDGNLTFYYNVSGGALIEHCDLYVDDQLEETAYSVPRNTLVSISSEFFSVGRHQWYISCTDPIFTRNSTETRYFDVINTSTFGGFTTDFSTLNTSAIVNFFVENVSVAKINFTEVVNLSGGSNITQVVNLSNNRVVVDTELEPRLNKSAIITLYNLPFKTIPLILQNGDLCPSNTCKKISYKPLSGTFVFNVTHFTNYSAGENANLTIWDDVDLEGGGITRYVTQQVGFFANYTNRSSGLPINGSNVYCSIIFNESGSWSDPVNMTYNETNGLYEYNRSFSQNATYMYNVSCDGLLQGQEPLIASDDVLIKPLPDLVINEILFSVSEFVEGDFVTISVNLSNTENVEAENVSIQLNCSLYNGSKILNETINSSVFNLSAFTSKWVNFSWTVKIGKYIFDFGVDVEDDILEKFETNNFNTTNRTTSAWQILYGMYNYSFFLSDSLNTQFTNWTDPVLEGNIFYSDIDSSYIPINLYALNETGDLDQADAALGLTGFSDSLKNLYDANDDNFADQTMNLEIGGVLVTGIPIINSTNSSAFVTGILWDSADGVSYTGGEDLVFVSFINSSQDGAYGNYDYEIRLPSPLERLFGSLNEVKRIEELQ